MLDSGARGDVAQLEEHRVRIAGVRGSSPLISTTLISTTTPRPTRLDRQRPIARAVAARASTSAS